ncbi:MAG: hypothetical protein D6722_26565 [Bacteroidetes bacterium]|nr:MAG: hypothetical protein D6722_26565 [Bacteroidota bacterium]
MYHLKPWSENWGELYSESYPKLTLILGRFVAPGYFIHYFKGKMDELRIYNRALSKTEILELSNRTSTNLSEKAYLKKGDILLSPNPARRIHDSYL